MSIGYQQHTNSNELNIELQKNFEAIANLTETINLMTTDIQHTKVINNVNLEFIKRDFNNIVFENEQLRRKLENSGTFNKKIFISATELIPNDLYSLVDPKYNLATFQSSNIVPISHIDTSKGKYIPDDLIIDIQDDFEQYMYVETDKKNMIVGDLNTPWYREYHIDSKSPIDKISLVVTINMPYNSINSYFYNNVMMTPFPFSNLNIDKIEVYSDEAWERIDGDIKKAKHIYIQNKLKSIQKIRITITQDKFLLINSQKIFYVGISDLRVSQIKTEAEKICFKYDYTPDENIIINSVDALIDKQFITNSKEYFEYELMQLDTSTGYSVPINKYNHIYIDSGNTIRFLFYLYRHEITPVLRQIVLNYSRNI